jgi:uncharacterized protein
MELSLERPGAHLFIRSVSAAGIEVEERLYQGPLIVSASQLIEDWSATALADLTEAHFDAVFDLSPEIVLIGTGPEQLFPGPELLMCFYRRNIGVECMTTRAACRTFNVLAGERRNVVAALLPPGPNPEGC